MDALQSDDEHRPVGLREDRVTNLDPIVRPHREEEPIEGRVVQLAQREAVRDRRSAVRVGVRCDVRCIEKLSMSESAQSAPLAVGANDPFTKRDLVTPSTDSCAWMPEKALGRSRLTAGVALLVSTWRDRRRAEAPPSQR